MWMMVINFIWFSLCFILIINRIDVSPPFFDQQSIPLDDDVVNLQKKGGHKNEELAVY